MREVERAWRRKQFKRRILFGAAMGAVALVAVGVPAIFFGAKVEQRQAVQARTEAAKKFDRGVSATIARYIDDIMRQSGLCGSGCAKHDPATISWQWQIVTSNGALLADLYAWQQAPGSYALYLYGLSARPDGALYEEPRIARTLVALLQRFGYPGAAQPFVTRDQSSGNSHYRAIGPKPVAVLWGPFPGKDRMRGQWQFTVRRTGPFTEEGSWLAER